MRARGGLSLTEVLLAVALLLAALVPLAALMVHDRSGFAALDRELQATAAATAVLELLKTVPYDDIPITPGTEPVPDTQWDAARVPPARPGGAQPLAGQFAPMTGGVFSRTLRLEELRPWAGSSRTLKLATVIVQWRQPVGGGAERQGSVQLRTILSPAREFDASGIVEP